MECVSLSNHHKVETLLSGTNESRDRLYRDAQGQARIIFPSLPGQNHHLSAIKSRTCLAEPVAWIFSFAQNDAMF